MAERILITGGAGFLGSALASSLRAGRELVILDNLGGNSPGCAGPGGSDGIRFVRGDVCDRDCVRRAARGCLRVVHLASVAGVSAVEADPGGTMRTAVAGTGNVVAACLENPGLKRLVIVSSSEVYGSYADHVDEDAEVVPPDAAGARWSYALGKLEAERLGLSTHARHGLPVTVVRPFNIYGPGQVGEGAVHTFVERALAGLPLSLHNGGRQVRAWCHVDDLADGLVRAIFSDMAVGQIFNLGNPAGAITVRELARLIVRLAGSKSPIVERPRPGPEVRVRIPDITRARRLLQFSPRVGLEEGLTRTVEWYRRRARAKEAAHG